LFLDLSPLVPYGLGALKRLVALGSISVSYLTAHKLANVLRCELEKLHRTARPRSLPPVAIIDVNSSCNLRCPYCPTGTRRTGGRSRTLIDPSIPARLLQELGSTLLSANLYNWGEPLLHPDIASMVKAFHESRVATVLSTNLSSNRSQVLGELCDAGLDFMTVSMSGATQATYEVYHRGGRLDQVIENTRHLLEFRKSRGSKRPIVEWKYLLFSHNAHEVRAARSLARKIGVDIFRTFPGGGEESALADVKLSIENLFPPGLCDQLWHAVVVQSDGGIAPCCYLFFKKDDLAEYTEAPLTEIRQRPEFVTARLLFRADAVQDLPADLEHPCLKCYIVHKQEHLRDYLASNPHAVKDHRTGGA
jgi:pyruvate-formate lyase-activating enzyme